MELLFPDFCTAGEKRFTMEMNEVTVQMIAEMVAKAMAKGKAQDTAVADSVKCDAGDTGKALKHNGIFDSVDEAVQAAHVAQKKLMELTIEERAELIESIRENTKESIALIARMELEETGMGRYEDKLRKLIFTIENTPGTEDIRPEVFSGDYGLTLVERRPFGVVCCITPSTGPSTTVIHNSICMIAAGNSVVFSPHPQALKTSLKTIEVINAGIAIAGGPDNIITCLSSSSMENTGNIMKDPKISLILATGGPSVVHTVLSSGKKAIGAGPGNPPALVDETADLANAAKCIIAGSHFENGIQCVGEKEIVVIDSVADELIVEMEKNGAYLIRDKAMIDKLTNLVTRPDGTPNKDYIGKDPEIILKAIGIETTAEVKAITYEAPKDHITVVEEYLMSLLPIVRAKDIDEAIELAVRYEGGRRHSAIMHSKNVTNMTRFAKAVSSTIFVKNGPSYSGMGLGGEGHMTMSVAGPTGEGLTSPRTFTRSQRCSLIGDFNLRSSTLKRG